MKNKLTLLALLLLTGIFAHAQFPFSIYDPEDKGDNYGDGTQNMIGQRQYFWDVNTATWTNSDTFNMQYNSQNLQTLQNRIVEDTSVNGPWKNTRVSTREYDANNRLIVRVDTIPNDPLGDPRYEFTYNSSGKEILAHQFIWNTTQANWVDKFRRQTSYTGFDSINVQFTEFWNSGTQVWTNYERYVHTYNPQNLDSIVTYERWNTGTNAWGGYYQNFYTYNTNGNFTYNLRKFWINYLSAYRNESQTSYSYDGSNRLISSSPAAWDTATNGWKYDFRYTYSYNAQGLLENELTEKYNTNNAQWDFFNLVTHTYDANNRLSEVLYQKWVGNAWQNSSKDTYTRDANGYRTRLLIEFWNPNTLSFRNYGAIDYWYSAKQTNGIGELGQDQLFAFPNPSGSPVTFVNADKNLPYAVYDMQGRMVQQGNLQTGTNSIILNEAKGNYILKAGNSSTILVKQ